MESTQIADAIHEEKIRAELENMALHHPLLYHVLQAAEGHGWSDHLTALVAARELAKENIRLFNALVESKQREAPLGILKNES